jgi:hypothetical protein
MSTGSGLGTLAGLEVEGLALRDLVETPAELRRRELVEVPGVRLLLLRQHAAFSGADARSGQLGAHRQGRLGLLRERAEAHVAHEEGDLQLEGPRGRRPHDQSGVHRVVIQEGPSGELRGQELKVAPAGQLVERHAHGRDLAVVPESAQAVPGERLDVAVVRLFGRSVHVLIRAQVLFAPVGLRVLLGEGRDLGLIDPDRVRLRVDLRCEPVQRLFVAVLADARVESVVPSVHAADQVGTVDVPIGEQRPTMMTATVHHGDLVIVPDHDQVHVRDEGVRGGTISELTPSRHSDPGSGRRFLAHARLTQGSGFVSGA